MNSGIHYLPARTPAAHTIFHISPNEKFRLTRFSQLLQHRDSATRYATHKVPGQIYLIETVKV